MKTSKYQQLAEHLAEQIINLQSQEKLPSIRKLCDLHSVSKITVQQALHSLESRGLIYAKPKSGYYVAERKESDSIPMSTNIAKPKLIDMPHLFHEIMKLSAAFDICPQVELNNQDKSVLNRHLGRALRQDVGTKTHYYDAPEGDPGLRKLLQEHYRFQGLNLSMEEICITGGCQNSLFLALMACTHPGDVVAVETPAFYGVLQLIHQMGLKVVEIPSSANNGITPQSFEAAAKKWPIKACVVTPSFATPTGACMKEDQKREIVKIANDYFITLIEDDIYGDLGFHTRPKPLKAYDEDVILCSSFSKSLSRDLRVGWIMGGKHHDKISHLKLITQLSSSRSMQQGVASFLSEGYYRRHLVSYRQQLHARLEQLKRLQKEYWDFDYSCSEPQGGLALWVNLPKQVDTLMLYQLLKQLGIVITPGMLFSAKGEYNNCMRLSFAHPFDNSRQAAIRKIGELVKTF